MNNESNQVALAKPMKDAQENYNHVATLETARFLAKLYKAYFDAYVKEGFTELQALRLAVKDFN